MLQTDHLDTLVAVLDAGTFEGAAARLHITPSAVSQRVKAMEQLVGHVVLQRTNPVGVTSAGAAIVQLARQVQLLMQDLDRRLSDAAASPHIPIAVSADALATWFLPAIAEAHQELGVTVALHREDQANTADLLRSGTVMAAVTSDPVAVQGCTVTALGVMRYRAVATRSFRDRWLRDGDLASAPVIDFDEADLLQRRFAGAGSDTAPRHRIPTSSDFARAVRLGMGWGLLPDQQSGDALASGDLIDLAPDRVVDIALYWQRWNLASPALDGVSGIVLRHARTALAPIR